MDRPSEPLSTHPTRLLTLGAEGVSLDVLGRLVDGAWRYRVVRDQRTLASFDPELEGTPLYDESEWTPEWQDVLGMLDELGAWNLYGVTVHPLIADRFERALAARDVDARALARWRDVIARSRHDPIL